MEFSFMDIVQLIALAVGCTWVIASIKANNIKMCVRLDGLEKQHAQDHALLLKLVSRQGTVLDRLARLETIREVESGSHRSGMHQPPPPDDSG